MEHHWLSERKTYGAWLLRSNTSLENGNALSCGKDYDLLLLRGTHVLAYTADTGDTDATLDEWEDIGELLAERISAFLNAPTHDVAFVCLPARRRTLVLLPAVGALGGEGVGLLPRAESETVGYALSRALKDRVLWLTGQPALPKDTACAENEEEVAIERLLQNALRLLDARTGSRRELAVRDRRQMSLYLCALGSLIGTFLGERYISENPRPFPIAYPFYGTFCPAYAAWMMLCFIAGLLRVLPWHKYPLRSAADHERLLPMVEITAGNRTHLPNEWQECARMAEMLGMYFDVRRTRSSILVRLCPIVPASEKEFAVRSSLGYHFWEELSQNGDFQP